MSSYGGFRGGGRGRGISFNLQGMKKDVRGVNIPPPPEKGVSKHGYSTLTAISQAAMGTSWSAQNKQRAKTEDDYFNEDDDDPSANQPSLAYQPAPGSPGGEFDSDSDDPLDAFMAGIEKEAKANATKKQSASSQKGQKDLKGVRDDIEDEDDEESYYRFIAENPHGAGQDDSDIELEYDEDGNPIAPPKSKHIDPLPPIDHSTITYAEFSKNFYVEHSDIAGLDAAKVDELRKTSAIKVTGVAPPKLVTSFAHFGLDEGLMKSIRKLEYTQPTPIQAQAVPAALSGRDVLGLAKTGSGKTAAFLWPMLTHIMDQPSLKPGEGPIGLILAPTRELAQQIYNEAKKFGKVYNLRVVCCYGGGSKWEQCKALEEGAEIVVATPGRMIDVIKAKATNLLRTTFLVLDEADRMFDMGFEPQVRSICNHVRPDRQTLLFSATFKKKVERLARDVLTDPIRILQGDVGEANADVTQVVTMFPTPQAKFVWLYGRLVELCAAGSVLIFVTKKANAEELSANLKAREYPALLLHGDMDQSERNKVITAFKKRESDILVATDVAARGLDIPHIRTVVNYDVARDIDTHTHRIGRTGRAGQKGTAYTLVMPSDKEFAGHLVRNLEGANQEVPKELVDLAMQSAWFRKSRFSGGKGRAPNVGGKGLGYTGNVNSQSAQSASSSYGANSGQVKSLGSAVGSPGQGRLATLKSAYMSQYKNMFCSASSTANAVTSNNTGSTSAPPAPPTAETGSDRPRKKSRWE